MKCSIVGCGNEAITSDEVPEQALKLGVKPADFCAIHQNFSNKLQNALQEKRKNAQNRRFEGE